MPQEYDTFTEDLSRVRIEVQDGGSNSKMASEKKAKKLAIVAKSRKSKTLSKQRGAARDYKSDQWDGDEVGGTSTVTPLRSHTTAPCTNSPKPAL